MNLFLLSLSLSFLAIARTTEKEKNAFISTSPKRVSLQDAIWTLEEIVHDEIIVCEFCTKHFYERTECEREKKNGITKYENLVTTPLVTDHYETTTIPSSKRTSCADLYNSGIRKSGVYTIYLKNPTGENGLKVYCDMDTDGGGWTVFQRRGEFLNTQPPENFNRNWKEYTQGFGKLNEEFWLGNENIYRLSMQDNVQLRVDMQMEVNMIVYSGIVNCDNFQIGNETDAYRGKTEQCEGFVDDFYLHSAKEMFTGEFKTYDRDNEYNCADKNKGGWWYGQVSNCESNYNSQNIREPISSEYASVKIKSTEIKIRPKQFMSEKE